MARNNADWHRLIELAALSHRLILDEDGIYDPAHFNDRLLLGLKGTMSEAELHVLEARLQGGIRNKARRGELELPLPIGLVYGADGAVALIRTDRSRRPCGSCSRLSGKAVRRAPWCGASGRKVGASRAAFVAASARATCCGAGWITRA